MTPMHHMTDVLETSYGPVDLAHCAPMIREEIELLGDADPFESQRDSAGRLRALVADYDDAALRWRPAPGEWSVVEVLIHLVHTEWVYGYRYRAIVANPEGPIAGYDQEQWVNALAHDDASVVQLLDELATMKSFNVAFLAGLTAEQRARWGVHSERGPESVAALIGAMAGHDLIHERQIGDNLDQWDERRPG
jgi:hypothetical protein